MNTISFMQWLETYQLNISPALIMGIVNVTPDSFSDHGRHARPQQAIQHALELIQQGADLIDICGESSRPGAVPVSIQEELDRVMPVIEGIRSASTCCLSIDTTKPEVMHAAIQSGVCLINDIHALRTEGALDAAASLKAPVCLMHMQGQPNTMQSNPHYPTSVINAINDFFAIQVQRSIDAGIAKQHILLDPGFGFGKTPQHNLYILNQLTAFQLHQCPILLGVSRKSTLGYVTGQDVHNRLIPGITAAIFTLLQGVAIIRTHDVQETVQARQMLQAILTHKDLYATT